jgi:hypothetical protein
MSAMGTPTEDHPAMQRELFSLMLDMWELLVEEDGVPGSVGEHLIRAVGAGRELLAQETPVVGASGEAESAGTLPPADSATPRPKPPAARTKPRTGTTR